MARPWQHQQQVAAVVLQQATLLRSQQHRARPLRGVATGRAAARL
jgi:hypothetical protein